MIVNNFIWKFFFMKMRSKFNSLENRILLEVKLKLQDPARILLEKQLEKINLIQRPGKRETNCYSMKHGKAVLSPNIQFPNKTAELRFASVKFNVHDICCEFSVDLYLVRGYFFSMVFSSDPSLIRNKGEDIKISEVQLYHNPMMPISEFPERSTHYKPFSGWLQELEDKYIINDKKPPIKEKEKERLLTNISAELPNEYLKFVEQVDGCTIQNCSILGIAEIYGVVMPGFDYYVLIKIGSAKVIAVRANSKDGVMYLLDFEGSEPIPLGNSFRQIIENLLYPPDKCV